MNNIKKVFITETLFSDVSFEIAEGEKVGIIGVNGSGKTTLFRILTGEEPIDEGNIYIGKELKIGYMRQHMIIDESSSLYDEALSEFNHLIDMEVRLWEIGNEIEEGKGNIAELIHRQATITEAFEREDGYTYKSRTKSTLTGLGFSEKELELSVSVLSGGQKTKLMLAKLLLSKSDLLLLDEPTNHLDVNAIAFLEEFLIGYKGAAIIISHDRYFLDRVTGKTIELENKRATVYKGNYSYYLTKKEEDRIFLEKQYSLTTREITRVEGIIEQQIRWGRERNFITARSKQKQVDKLKETLVKPEDDPEKINFSFYAPPCPSQEVLVVRDMAKGFGQKKLFKHVDIDVGNRQYVFLMGDNGSGKTTLFKILTEEIEADEGDFKLSPSALMAYYDQAQANLDENKTVIDEIWDLHPSLNRTQIRSALAAFLYKGDDVFKDIKVLSGGERARILLLKLMMSKANLLLLDEPTNHLDIHSKEALESALKGYNGALFIISHDRYFINKLADKIYYLTPNGVEKYDGNYDFYLEEKEKRKNLYGKAEQVVKKPTSTMNYKEQKEYEAAKRKLENRLAKIEEQIYQLEEQNAALHMDIEVNFADFEKLQQSSEKIEENLNTVHNLYEEYEQVSLALSEME